MLAPYRVLLVLRENLVLKAHKGKLGQQALKVRRVKLGRQALKVKLVLQALKAAPVHKDQLVFKAL